MTLTLTSASETYLVHRQHKYISRKRGPNGKWQYVYSRKTQKAINEETDAMNYDNAYYNGMRDATNNNTDRVKITLKKFSTEVGHRMRISQAIDKDPYEKIRSGSKLAGKKVSDVAKSVTNAGRSFIVRNFTLLGKTLSYIEARLKNKPITVDNILGMVNKRRRNRSITRTTQAINVAKERARITKEYEQKRRRLDDKRRNGSMTESQYRSEKERLDRERKCQEHALQAQLQLSGRN